VPPLPRSHVVAYVVAGLAVVLLGARWVQASGTGGEGVPARTAPSGAGLGEVRVEAARAGPAVIHVAGEVRRPGVYRVPAGTRVQTAIRRAGGATRRADLDALNLAAKVEDGRQVVVPRRVAAGGGAGAGATGAAAAAAGAAGAAVPAGPVNLNTADLAQLDTLDGVGPATAQKIIDFRTEHGGFSSVDELDQVPGIGQARMAALREKVTV
jgi:competence protein ComEA